jgi:3-deoxy-D-manno-octulosonic-acid transferase
MSLWDIFYLLSSPLWVPFLALHPRYAKAIKDRTGNLVSDRLWRPIWIHAASLGEAKIASLLASELKLAREKNQIVISTNTTSGFEFLSTQPDPCYIFYLPLDFTLFVRKALKRIRPRLLVLVEREWWPNLIILAARSGIPVILVNARLSPNSFLRYKRLNRALKGVILGFDLVCLRDPSEYPKFVSLGFPPERLQIIGDIKEDRFEPPDPGPFRSLFDIEPQDLVLIAGSTHEPEEEVFGRMFVQILSASQKVPRFIIAPRHVERCDQIQRKLEGMGINVLRRSRIMPGVKAPKGALILLDTMGELHSIYPLATVVFVGGTIAPIGGHNLAEPAMLGKPIIVGPHIEKINHLVRRLGNAGGLRLFQGEQDMAVWLRGQLQDPGELLKMGQRAAAEFQSRPSALQRTVMLLKQYLH